MSKYFRIAISAMVVLTLLLGCTPATGTAVVPTAVVQDQTIAMEATPSPVVQEAAVAQQAQSTSASLEGLVWDDLDRDGLQDLKEKGINKVTVNLFTSARTAAGTATTNGNGAYRFKDLAPGDYFVTLIPPAGFVFSPRDQGENELVDSDNDTTTAETIPVTLVVGENGLVFTTGIYSPTVVVPPDPGTVQPPPTEIDVCDPGAYSLGGISTLEVSQLAEGYCLQAFLWNHGFAVGKIPGGAGRILSDVTWVEVFYLGNFVYKYDVPGETESIQVCYAVPNGKQVQIYFFDHYGPRFGQPASEREWMPLETTIQDGIACAVAQTSGAYALIGK